MRWSSVARSPPSSPSGSSCSSTSPRAPLQKVTSRALFKIIPSSFALGYNIPQNDTALFYGYGMDDTVAGQYTMLCGRLNQIVYSNGWNLFYNMNQLKGGSLVSERVETREHYIVSLMRKIR